MLENIKWYRTWKGGTWFRICWDQHYIDYPYEEWTQKKELLEFPWFAHLIRIEKYDN